MSEAGLVRLLLGGYEPREKPDDRFYDVMRELNAIGNNMNQIAARANSTGFFLADEYARNADELRRALLEIQAAFTLPERG